MSGFVHLHLHTEYSLLDGACRISEIPKIAKDMGHNAVAITDHGVMYGAVDFYKACKENAVKAIIGCEVYVAQRSMHDKEYRLDSEYNHLILLVKNEIGYKNLIYIVSKAFEEGFYIKPRIDMELLEEHCDGLICLSACIAGIIPRMILRGDYQGALECAKKFDDMFGRGNFYLEVQNHGIFEEEEVRNGLQKIHEDTGIPFAATNDVHYLKKEDAEIQAVLMCLQTNTTVNDPNALRFENDEYYYKSTEEMQSALGNYEDSIINTQKIADMCNYGFTFGNTFLPQYVPSDKSEPGEYLKRLAVQGFKDRINKKQIVFDEINTEETYKTRMDYELSVISKMGYSEYYLIVWDFVNYAKSHNIPTGPGRGSGAGSLVAYLIGITEIDSIKHALLFERFLNPERISMPDFDIDFSDEKRDLVFDYVSLKYGKEHVCHIITFGTLAARACVRDVGRALGMSYNSVAKVAEAVPQRISVKNADGTVDNINKVTLDMALETKKLKEIYDNDPEARKLIDTAKKLEGMPRHASTHAAGVVITDKPVFEYVPMAVTKGSPVTQFDMNTVADLGLLKFDFLGLRFLTVIENTVKQIKSIKPEFDIENIPLDDKETFKMISDGETIGLFQLESDGMRSKLVLLRPETLSDIMAAIALYRPGPMNSIGKYIENKKNRDKIIYNIPELRPVLEETFGCIVYQEQVMEIFRKVADYSLGQADIIRKAMSKKQAGRIEQEREKFIESALKKDISLSEASELFEELVGFCKYAFNKSHAASYSVVTYRTAYLKCHYPKEYMASLLTSVIGDENKIIAYADECKRMGIGILPPDINESKGYFRVVGDNIRFALLALKNVGRTFVEDIVKERNNGVFTSFENFVNRMRETDLNKRQIETLIKSGCFDFSGVYRSQLLSCYEKIIENIIKSNIKNAAGQLDFFSVNEPENANDEPKFKYPDIRELAIREKLLYERECAGFCFSGNLLDNYSINEKAVKGVSIKRITDSFDKADGEYIIEGTGEFSNKQRVCVCGIVSKITEKTTRKGDKMLFVVIEDRTSQIEMLVFPDILEKYGYLFTLDNIIGVYGEISLNTENEVKLIVQKAAVLKSNEEYTEYENKNDNAKNSVREKNENKQLTLYLKVDNTECKEFKKALNLVEIFEGKTRVVFYDSSKKQYIAANKMQVDISEKILEFFTDLLGKDNICLK